MSLKSNFHLHKPVNDLDTMAFYFVDEITVIVVNNGENRMNDTYFLKINELLDEVER